jgi:hypothetical protein
MGERVEHHLRQVRVGELDRRNIDRDPKAVGPGCGIDACLTHHPFAQPGDEAGFLRNRNEQGWRNPPAIGVVPAQQRLEPGNPIGLRIDQRLVIDLQLTTVERVEQVLLQQTPVLSSLEHIAREEAMPAAAGILRRIEREVSIAGEIFGGIAVLRPQHDADRCADHAAAAIDEIGLRYGADELFRQCRQRIAVPPPVQHDLEFIATDPTDAIGMVQYPSQPGRDLGQQFVASRVAQRVVDLLEPVEIDQQDREGLIQSRRREQRLFDQRGNAAPVAKARQRVVTGKTRDRLGGFLDRGDVRADPLKAQEIACLVELGVAGHRPDPLLRIMGAAHVNRAERLLLCQQKPDRGFDRIALDLERACQLLAGNTLTGRCKLRGDPFADIGQTAIAVGGPEPVRPQPFNRGEQIMLCLMRGRTAPIPQLALRTHFRPDQSTAPA